MFWYLHIIRVNFYVSLNPRLFIRIVVKFTIHAKCKSPLCVFFPQRDVLCWWRSRFFTVTLRPCSIASTSIVRYVTWCPGTKWMWKKRKTRAAVSFICKKAESLPRHILGPACSSHHTALMNFEFSLLLRLCTKNYRLSIAFWSWSYLQFG
jgi:hypothetical protein